MKIIEELKKKAPLIPYIKQFYHGRIQITDESAAGASCRCIFHQEENASMRLYPDGRFKCFGCGKSGDVIDIVCKMEKTGFKEACIKIGSDVGFPIQFEPPNPYWEDYKNKMTNITLGYQSNLAKTSGPVCQATAYLRTRGISDETARKFGLGYVPPDEYTRRSDIGRISDTISIPILDDNISYPRCLGMAYCNYKYDINDMPKYKNDRNQTGGSGQDPNLSGVFIKGDNLFGYNQAYHSMVKSQFVFITEGYFDVMSMHQAGLTNTIGTMGISLSDVQLQKIKYNCSKNVVLFWDSDEPGQTAMRSVLKKLYWNSLDVHVVIMDGIKDPDELCRKYDFDGAKIYGYIMNHMMPGIDFYIQGITEPYRKAVHREKAKVLNEAYPFIESIQNPAMKEMFLSELKKQLDMK